MFTKEIFQKLDTNNLKALELTNLLITVIENGLDDAVDVVTNLEIVRDILKNNSDIFDVRGTEL